MANETRNERRTWKLPTETEDGFSTEGDNVRVTRWGGICDCGCNQREILYADTGEVCHMQTLAVRASIRMSEETYQEILGSFSPEGLQILESRREENSLRDVICMGQAAEFLSGFPFTLIVNLMGGQKSHPLMPYGFSPS
ncbi:hypothetical protein C5B42_05020 [Candidatus Cerribacteria bacterium 'Amazon FNV 2010 28 9']|uniref:Uncharacterized protein n=1 Tax=Candidatus Cerribacteria bacterium 'Amazon FNV 2010 28 9' TaxID=2081795 RepID=A0A317JQA4_9BACT|nr:MAG: hypothetical protein C5B42_05020 [Candidatus Cerribacteria bacterium 'Amazon FNV 2010 28 9']